MTEHIRLKMAAAKSRSLSDLSVNVGGDPGPMNEMEYVVMSTAGNAIDFGNLTVARNVAMSGFCSESRGICGGGYSGGGAGTDPGSGGGGSYNSGSRQSKTAGVREDHGQVIITLN